MTTESEVKLARYAAREKEADAFGRIITIRRLKPSEQTRISGMVADLTGFEDTEVEVTDPETGKVSTERRQVPRNAPLVIAAMVCEISDGQHSIAVSFPKGRAELDAIFDRLDVEGLEAATKAAQRLIAADLPAGNSVDEIKNSSRTPSSG